MPRILITGFGPFPGAPSNPTMAVVRHLQRLRHPRFQGVERLCHVLPTRWVMLEHFGAMIRQTTPDAVLMFGLAGRRWHITPELRAVNHASLLRLDAAGQRPKKRQLEKSNAGFRRSSIDPVRMVAALRANALPAKVSYDAGDYLCNALLWTALESGVPAIFVHIPRPRRMMRPKGAMKRPRPAMLDIKRAAEVALASVITFR
jgi:pyroglutamyl-peptidase